MEIAPGLKSIFASLRPRSLIREVFEFGGRSIDFDWSIEDDFDSHLYLAINAYGENGPKSNLKLWASWCSDLYDIHSICSQYKSKKKFHTLWEKMDKRGLAQKYLAAHRDAAPAAQKLLAWVFVYDHDGLWAQLLKDAVIEDISGSGGRRYYIDPVLNRPEEKKAIWGFKEAFLGYMKKSQNFIEHLHVERNDLGRIDRFVMHVNPFPRNVEQFQKDELKLQLDQNAEGFSVVYYPDDRCFRIKCHFTKKQTDKIAEYFAVYILGSKIVEKPDEYYPIKSLNPNFDPNFELRHFDENVLSCRICGLRVGVDNPISGDFEEISHKCKSGNVFACAANSLKEYDVKWRTLLQLDFKVVIAELVPHLIQGELFSNGGEKEITHTYDVHITEGRFNTNCHNPDELKIIRDFFERNGIKDMAGGKVLKGSLRK